jgi:endogenous inhibitor of DNA gyrase (YacG/DUF329 family)
MKKVRCPACRGWASWEDNPFRPFCSERCKKVDLGNWAMEKYRVPVEEEESGEKEKSGKEE